MNGIQFSVRANAEGLIGAAKGAAVACLLAASFSGNLLAQAYPAKAITIQPTFAASGSPLMVVRSVADAMSEKIGRPIVIENRTGGLGAVGLSLLHRAEPDGYTLSFTFTGAILVNPHVTAGLDWDANSFSPITRLVSTPVIWIGSPNFPVKSIAELIAEAKKKPESVSVAIGGAGNKIGLAQFEAATGTKFLWVPVASGLLNQVLGSHVNMGIETPATVAALVKDGKVTALGMGSLKRSALMPTVPAIAETIPGFESGFWFGILGPPGMARDRVEFLNRELTAAINTPAVKERLVTAGFDVVPEKPEEFAAYLKKTNAEYAKIIKDYKITN